jgi:hypothetical protein
MMIRRKAIETVGDDHRTLTRIVVPTVSIRSVRGGGRTVWVRIENGIWIVSDDDAPTGRQGRRPDVSPYGWLNDTSMVVMTVIIGSLMSQAAMSSRLPHASYHRSHNGCRSARQGGAWTVSTLWWIGFRDRPL